MFTAPEGVRSRSQQTLPQVKRTQQLGLPQGEVAEVIAGRNALVSFEETQLATVYEAPLLKHQPWGIGTDEQPQA